MNQPEPNTIKQTKKRENFYKLNRDEDPKFLYSENSNLHLLREYIRMEANVPRRDIHTTMVQK